ncbi:MAG: hypothetical protein Q4P30_05960, partial [Eubacteriales bacterium]|nr:hypothetical protein [Eubacteriales bacterium]
MRRKDRKYWVKRQKQFLDNLEKNDIKLAKKMDRMYTGERKRLEKEIAAYHAKYGRDNVIEYKDLLESLASDEKRMLYEDYQRFFSQHPEYAH